MAYLAEYTDTFGGEANYCWVRRATIEIEGEHDWSARKERNIVLARARKERNIVLARARKELGLSGVRGKIVLDCGDEWHWKPYGCCTILMVRWDDTPQD